jgi:hypothetical protein
VGSNLLRGAGWWLALLPLATGGAPLPPSEAGEPIAVTPLFASQQSEIVEPRRQVIRDADAFAVAWQSLGRFAPPPVRPAVDFGRQQVILAALGTQPCVSHITVRGARRSPSEVVVDLLEEPSAPECVCVVDTRPVDVVRMPRIDLPVRFAVSRRLATCGGG